MTSSLLIKCAVVGIVSCVLLGCIADNPEDSNLPWASSKSWEGMAPIAPSVMNQYD
jgi:hypothetical protein